MKNNAIVYYNCYIFHKLYFLVLLGGIHRILTSQTHWSLIVYMIPKQFIDNNHNIYFNAVAA